MEDVQKCTDVIGIVERRWPATGRLRDIITFLATPAGSSYPSPERTKQQPPQPVVGVKRERSTAERPTKGSRGSKSATTSAASRPSTSPRAFQVLPSIRLRTARGTQETTTHPSGPAAGVSPTDPRAMGPPSSLEYTYPTTPAQWYDSAHPDGTSSSAGAPVASTNGGTADHAGTGTFAYYPPGPSAAPPPHAQESFMRRDLGDGGVASGMRGMPMWSGPGGAPASQDYQ